MSAITWQQLAELPVFSEFHRLVRELFGLDVILTGPDHHAMRQLGPWRQPRTFCAALHRQGEGLRRCVECDVSHARRVARTRLPSRYRCHAGLTEFIIPILIEGEAVGHLVCGAVLDHAPTAADWRRTRRRLAQEGYDSRRLWAAYRQTPVIPVKTQKALLALLQLFAHHVASTHARIQALEQDPRDRVMARALDVLKGRLSAGVRISEVAVAAGTSQRNLLRICRARTGATVLGYQQRLRIDHACNQLRETHAKIADIALESGFGSVQQFNRVFRKLIGDTPRAWREKARRAIHV